MAVGAVYGVKHIQHALREASIIRKGPTRAAVPECMRRHHGNVCGQDLAQQGLGSSPLSPRTRIPPASMPPTYKGSMCLGSPIPSIDSELSAPAVISSHSHMHGTATTNEKVQIPPFTEPQCSHHTAFGPGSSAWIKVCKSQEIADRVIFCQLSPMTAVT